MRREWMPWIAGTAVLVILASLATSGRIAAERSPQASTDLAPDTARVVLEVNGMVCTSCASTVEAMLTRRLGVAKASVDVERAQAVIDYDAERVAPQDLVEVVRRLGYKAVVKSQPVGPGPAGEKAQL